MQFLNTDFLVSEEIKLVVNRLAEGNPERNWVPAYHFHICNLDGTVMGDAIFESDIPMGFIMEDISDIAFMKRIEGIITQPKLVVFFLI